LILAEAKAVLQHADQVRDTARLVRLGEAGDLRLWVMFSISFVRAFNETIDAFQRDHPGLVLDLVQTTAHVAFEAFQQRKIDLCVVRHMGPQLDGIEQMVIARDRLMLVLPSHHPKAHAEKIALDDVASDRFIQFAPEKSNVLFKRTWDLWTHAGRKPLATKKVDSGLAILALVGAGFGSAILPSTLSALQMPNVVWKPIDIDEQWTISSIVMLYRTNPRDENIQSRFVNYVKRFFPRPGEQKANTDGKNVPAIALGG